MKKITLVFFTLTIAFSQSVEIKDGDGNSLITVNDEGTAGSISLPNVIKPVSFDDRLMNLEGNLYWDKQQLAIVGGTTTKYLAIPACAFVPFTNETPYFYRSWKIANYPSGDLDLYAPVILPHGANVTEFAATIYDQEPPGGSHATIELVRNIMSGSTHSNESMASLLSVSYSGWDTYAVGSITSSMIDNSNYEYFLHLTWDFPTDENRINFHSARIEYTE